MRANERSSKRKKIYDNRLLSARGSVRERGRKDKMHQNGEHCSCVIHL